MAKSISASRSRNLDHANEISPLVKRYVSHALQSNRSLLMIDSSETFRMGLRSAIAATSQLVIVGEVDSAAALRDHGIPERVDVAVVDVDLPDQNSLWVCQWLTAQRPGLISLLLSFRDWDIYLAAAYAISMAGLLLRGTPTRQLVDAIAAAVDAPLYTTKHYDRIHAWEETIGTPLRTLNLREWSLLWLVTDGISYHEISQRLSLSQNTIERQVSSLLNKLSLSSSRQLQSFVYTHHLEVLRGLDSNSNPFSADFSVMSSMAGT
jgi:DNA-binding NarL/FixJ family response regulator